MNREEIINRISIIRTRANLSARALSQLIDMNDGYISRLESKKDFLPTMEVFMRILTECNTTPEEFFYHNINNYKTDTSVLEKLDSVSEEKKQAILTLLK